MLSSTPRSFRVIWSGQKQGKLFLASITSSNWRLSWQDKDKIHVSAIAEEEDSFEEEDVSGDDVTEEDSLEDGDFEDDEEEDFDFEEDDF